MKKFSKVLSLVLVLAMVFALSATAFAADPVTANLVPDKTLTIKGLETGDVVNLYKVVQWDANTGWALTTDFAGIETSGIKDSFVVGATDTEKSIRDNYAKSVLTYITGLPAKYTTNPATGKVTKTEDKVLGRVNSTLAAELAKIAKTKTAVNASDDAKTITSTKQYTYGSEASPVEPGLYIALIDAGKKGVMYNPVFVAADYNNEDGGAGIGDSQFVNEWTVDLDDSYSDQAIAKKSEITLEKTVTDLNPSEAAADAAASTNAGDIVKFTITTTIPEYADNYTSAHFKASDSLSEGLTLVVDTDHPVTVTASGDGVTPAYSAAKDTDYTLTAENGGSSLVVDFKSDYILNRTKAIPVTITYYAKVDPTIAHNVDTTNNTVTVEYSNNPTDDSSYGKLKDITNHYTYSLDAELFGNSEYETSELVKIGLDKDGNPIVKVSGYDNGITDVSPLQGAVFGLFTSAEAANAAVGKDATQLKNADGIYKNSVYTDGAIFTSNDLGKMNIQGLDGNTTYYLVETKAPDGFVRDTTVRTITITPTYKEVEITENLEGIDVTYKTDVLDTYAVAISDGTNTSTSTYKMTYKDTTVTEGGTEVEVPTNAIVIENSSSKTEGTDTEKAAADNSHFIVNTQGTELPSTGGIGTTIFYIVGAALVIGAGVVLVTRRRVQA